jgi:hypothetical protein
MDTETRAALSRVLPSADIVGHEQIEAVVDKELPRSRFPSLRDRRLRFPLLRKLVDVHVGRQGWRMFLDSDMLFFREPTAMLDWLRAPDVPCCMADIQYAYGYAEDVMSSLVGKPIPPRVNTGICGLKSDAIDWDRIEQWQRALQAVDGGNHLQEQAMTAMIMADGPHFAFPREDYLIMPSREEVLRPTAVMHHYVWQAKPLYFRYAWRHVLARAAQPITIGRSE